MSDSVVSRAAALVDEYLLLWVLLSVGVGVAVPSVALLAPLSTPILAVMIGSVSLTLAPDRFRALRGRAVIVILVVQTAMPLFAFGLAWMLSRNTALTAGFVVLGAVTPELLTPTITELSSGDTALATVVLVLVGLGSLVFVPGAITLLLGSSVTVDSELIIQQLLLTVVRPMVLAVAARYRWPARVGQYDAIYPSVSGLMVILIIGIVAAANASLVRNGGAVLGTVVAGAVFLNVGGYGAG